MFKQMLVPLDGSPLAERVLPVACAMAVKCGATLTLLHVLEKHARPTVHAERHLTEPDEAEAYLREATAKLACGAPRVEHHVHTDRVGHVGRSIVDHANEIGADVVALTTHGAGGVRRALFGSIAQKVLAHWPRPILLLPSLYADGRGNQKLEQFLVPVDLDPSHAPAVNLALDLAHTCQAEVECLGVAATAATLTGGRSATAQVQPFAMAALLAAEEDEYAERFRQIESAAAALSVSVRSVTDTGPAGPRILREIDHRSPDLVIFGSHRRRGLDAAFTGSVGQQLCNRSKSPLLVVPV